MKHCFRIVLISLLATAMCPAQQPEKIYSVAKVRKTHEYYVSQAGLWWNIVNEHRQDEDGWYNYFAACRMAGLTNQDNVDWLSESPALKKGDDIVALIEKNIPGTFTAHYVKWWNHGADIAMFDELKKAAEIDPDRVEIYDGFVVYGEVTGNPAMRKEYNLKWYASETMSTGLLYFNYNVLQSLDKDAVLLTGGDNDTLPIWMLQDVKGIRKDVIVLNISLLSIPSYRHEMFGKLKMPDLNASFDDGSSPSNLKEIVDFFILNHPVDRPVYFTLTSWKQFNEYSDKLYLTGLVSRFSEENIDNIATLRNNFENKYLLDYLKMPLAHDISESVVNYINVNYLPGMIKLHDHYLRSGDTASAGRIRDLAMIIAKRAGDDWTEKTMEMFNTP